MFRGTETTYGDQKQVNKKYYIMLFHKFLYKITN